MLKYSVDICEVLVSLVTTNSTRKIDFFAKTSMSKGLSWDMGPIDFE